MVSYCKLSHWLETWKEVLVSFKHGTDDSILFDGLLAFPMPSNVQVDLIQDIIMVI